MAGVATCAATPPISFALHPTQNRFRSSRHEVCCESLRLPKRYRGASRRRVAMGRRANTPGTPRLWPSLPDATRHRLTCLVAQLLRQQLYPGSLGEPTSAERDR